MYSLLERVKKLNITKFAQGGSISVPQLFLSLFKGKVLLYNLAWPEAPNVNQAGLELTQVRLPLSRESWD